MKTMFVAFCTFGALILNSMAVPLSPHADYTFENVVVQSAVDLPDPEAFCVETSIVGVFNFNLTTNDPNKVLRMEVSENEVDWTFVRYIKAGQGSVPPAVKEGESYRISPTVSTPFLIAPTGKEFVRFSVDPTSGGIAPPEVVVPTTSDVTTADCRTVTFDSQPNAQYMVLCAKDLDPNQADHWMPADTVKEGVRIETISTYSFGDTTTVTLANPLLPWYPENSGRIKVVKVSSAKYSAKAKAVGVTQEPKVYTLVAISEPTLPNPKMIKLVATNPMTREKMILQLNTTGPKVGSYGKYFQFTCSASAVVGNNKGEIPDAPGGLVKTVSVSLTNYTGDTPSLYFEPAIDTLFKVVIVKGILAKIFELGLHLEGAGATAAVVWDQTPPFSDTWQVEKKDNVFVSKNVVAGKEVNDHISVQASYGFSAMLVSEALEFQNKIQKKEQK